MHILLYRTHFNLKYLARNPFKSLRIFLVQLVIRLFSQSKYHHIAHAFKAEDGKWRVSEAKYPFEEVNNIDIVFN